MHSKSETWDLSRKVQINKRKTKDNFSKCEKRFLYECMTVGKNLFYYIQRRKNHTSATQNLFVIKE